MNTHTTHQTRRTVLAAALVAGLALTGCRVPDLPEIELPELQLPDALGTPAEGPLPIAAEDIGAQYDRDAWPHWSPAGNGCDTRQAVLIAQGRHVRTGDGCRVPSGTWTSRYDGTTVTDPADLDIDHIVPLAEVQRSGRIAGGRRVGPRQWSEARRERYANDPAGLVAVTATSNRSKGDQDPASWLPDRDRCGYVRHWVRIKHRYQLAADPDESRAITAVLTHCPGGRR